MEDDVVQGRCLAIIQQLINTSDKRLQIIQEKENEQQQSILNSLPETLRQRAMLIYRLCRAKHEDIAADQTEDAAYCVLAAIAFCQPILWNILTKWSRALRPRSPELRFGAPFAISLRLKDVELFITRTTRLQSSSSSSSSSLLLGVEEKSPSGKSNNILKGSMISISTSPGSRKHPREEESINETNLEPEIAAQLAFTFFQMNTPNLKKLHEIVAVYAREIGGVKLIDTVDEAVSISNNTKTTITSNRKGNRNSILLGDGINGNSSNSASTNSAIIIHQEEDEEDDDIFDSSIAFPLNSPSFLGSNYTTTTFNFFDSSMNLNTFAENVVDTCLLLFYNRLKLCLQNPLLYSPLACITEANNITDSEYDKVNEKYRLDMAYLISCQNSFGSSASSLLSPAHFLHPSRTRIQFLLPLPLQMVTSQLLWMRLLIAGLWIQVVEKSPQYDNVLQYCVCIVKSAQRNPSCAVCDGMTREKPILKLAALSHDTLNMSNNEEVPSWEEIKNSISISTFTEKGKEIEESLCERILGYLSKKLWQKVQKQVEKNSIINIHNNTSITLNNNNNNNSNNNKNGCRSFSPPPPPPPPPLSSSSQTLIELLEDVRGCYPLAACRAALIGGTEGEEILRHLIKEKCNNNEKTKSYSSSFVTDTQSINIKEILNIIPYIPRLREVDAVLECAACLQLFHQDCVCPVQRDPCGGIFLCHACRLAHFPLPLIPPILCTIATNPV